MPTLPPSLAELLDCFRPCFTAPTFQTLCALTTGFLAQTGPRTVTGMLAGARLVGRWHHSRAHRFFSHARWSADQVGLALLEVITTRLLGPGAPLRLVVDDTLFHRSGRKVFGVAWHHDPAAKGGRRIAWGNNWVVLGVLVHLPFLPQRAVCLPVLARLWRPKHPDRTKLPLACALVTLVAERYPDRSVHLVATVRSTTVPAGQRHRSSTATSTVKAARPYRACKFSWLGSALPCPAGRSVPGRGGPERRRRPRPDGTGPRSVLGPWRTGTTGARAVTNGHQQP